jgi:hypothetical protein
MVETVKSMNAVPIRSTDERWIHISEEHAELAGYRLEVLEAVAMPDRILKGNGGELLAIKAQPDGKQLVVVYRELSDDGFIITDFLTRRTTLLESRVQVWP